MEQGDWCSVRWVDAESVLAVPGLLCFHSAAPVTESDQRVLREARVANLTQESRWPCSANKKGPFVCKAII